MCVTSLSENKSQDTSVGIATGYGPNSQGLIPGRGEIFFFSVASRLTLGPTQPPIQWVPGVKLLGRESDHSPPSSAEVKNGGAIYALPNMSSWHRG
jgi:hypothetical protein